MTKSNRFQVITFLVLTFLISWIEEYFIVRGEGIKNPLRSFCLMWTPGIVGIACSLFFDRNLKSLALRLPTVKSVVIAYFVPAITAVLMVGLLDATSMVEFQISPQLIEKKGTVPAALFAALVLAPTVGMILACISGLGEELGWRGFLHTKLLHLTPMKRYLLVGILWSVYSC